jgi:hypothetical protein
MIAAAACSMVQRANAGVGVASGVGVGGGGVAVIITTCVTSTVSFTIRVTSTVWTGWAAHAARMITSINESEIADNLFVLMISAISLILFCSNSLD